ncbi:MAG: heme-binding protein [Alphaproteobacteria bacterium]|nr:heme-binding protein [Alphaproteobacteria bacterium]
MRGSTLALAAAIGLALSAEASAQTPPPGPPPPAPAYGSSIGLEAAKKAAAAAEAEVPKAGSNPDVIAVVDTGGHLIYLERMDNAQIASVRIAIDKARAAAMFRRPTKVFEDAVAGGRIGIMTLHGAIASEGGLPLMIDGKIVGAIGASGGTSQQDGQVAKAGADTVK